MVEKLPRLADLQRQMESGEQRAETLLKHCRTTEAQHDLPGGPVYLRRFTDTAPAEARAADLRRAAGLSLGDLDGMPVSVKALFDVAGMPTCAGSALEMAPAVKDAFAVRQLRQAGAVITGHTNMTEFAFSGLGLNPHHGAPANPYDERRIPGGSSAGAAVSVATGMAAAALGTDTGGSVRIPATFCGLTGFKPSQSRISLEGVSPLADSYDTVGPIGGSVQCCASLYAVLSGQSDPLDRKGVLLRNKRFAVPANYVLEQLSPTVAGSFSRSLTQLSHAGAIIEEVRVPVLDRLPELLAGGGLTAAESHAIHRDRLQTCGHHYDPRVRRRIEKGGLLSAADYVDLRALRRRLVGEMDHWLAGFDGLLMPSVAVEPPTFAELGCDDEFDRLNLLVLRNPTVGNLLNLCAMTLPNHASGELPSGIMLACRNGHDGTLLRLAQAVEQEALSRC